MGIPGRRSRGGESHEETIPRELAEEAGRDQLELVSLSGHVRTSPRSSTGAGTARASGSSSCGRGPSSQPPRLSRERLNRECVTAIHWWTPAELEASDAVYAPRRLPELVFVLVRGGPAAETLRVLAEVDRSGHVLASKRR